MSISQAELEQKIADYLEEGDISITWLKENVFVVNGLEVYELHDENTGECEYVDDYYNYVR